MVRRKLCYSTNKYLFEFTNAPYDEVNLKKRTELGIISDNVKMGDIPIGKTSLIFSPSPAVSQVETLR